MIERNVAIDWFASSDEIDAFGLRCGCTEQTFGLDWIRCSWIGPAKLRGSFHAAGAERGKYLSHVRELFVCFVWV